MAPDAESPTSSTAGAGVLVVYGAANIAGAVIGLTGLAGEPGDRAALWGHAALWDPLFLLWGLALAAALVTERRESAALTRPARSPGSRPPP